MRKVREQARILSLSSLPALPALPAEPPHSFGLTSHRRRARPPVLVVVSRSQPLLTRLSSRCWVCSASRIWPRASRRISSRDTSVLAFALIHRRTRRALAWRSLKPDLSQGSTCVRPEIFTPKPDSTYHGLLINGVRFQSAGYPLNPARRRCAPTRSPTPYRPVCRPDAALASRP